MDQAIGPIINLLAVLLGGLFARHITRPKDLDKAKQLAIIAEGAAALVVSLHPKGAWGPMLKAVIAQIKNAAGLDITNDQAIERAAAKALTDAQK